MTIKLTYKEWELVQSQCMKCSLWNHELGCRYPDFKDSWSLDRQPAENCGLNSDERREVAKALGLPVFAPFQH